MGEHPLGDHGHVGLHEQPTVERSEWCVELQRLDQHRHAPWRATTRHREADPCPSQRADGRDGTRGEDLVLGDQGAVDVGQQELDTGPAAVGLLSHGAAQP